MKLQPVSFGLAGGILGGLAMLIMTLLAILNGYGAVFLAIMADIYPYYDITYTGALLGLVYGFIDGFVGFAIIARLYNMFLPKK